MTNFDHGLSAIRESGWSFPSHVWDNLSDYEKSFAVLELNSQKTPEYYKSRLTSLGFSNIGRVLDAACGMGQWTVAMEQIGNSAVGIDLMPSRISVARELAASHGGNCEFFQGSIEALPFPDSSFDGVFCYGAFMFTKMRVSLGEFARVLKPGGILYINCNTWGWYAHLIIDRGLKKGNFSIIYSALYLIARKLMGKSSQILVSESWIRKELSDAGFSIAALGPEGGVSVMSSHSVLPPPAYPPKFYGLRSIIELIAVKSS